MGLPVSSRLRSSGEFALVRNKGTTFPGKYLVLSVWKPDTLKEVAVDGAIEDTDTFGVTGDFLSSCPFETRYGFITSKKVGNAVTRNRLRRQLREIARLNPLLPGYWVVTIMRWRAAQATFDELRQDWLRAAKRARLLPKPGPDSTGTSNPSSGVTDSSPFGPPPSKQPNESPSI